MARTWIFTGSPEDQAATRERGFAVIGLNERNRNRALEIELGDRVAPYATGVMGLAGSIRDRTLAFEDQIGQVSDHDARVLLERLTGGTGVTS